MDHANPGIDGWLGRLLPGLANLGQKSTSRLGGLRQRLISSAAVDADRRGTHQHLGFRLQPGKHNGERAGGFDTAFADLPFVRRCPALPSDVGPGEMDGARNSGKPLWVVHWGGRVWVPYLLRCLLRNIASDGVVLGRTAMQQNS